jgi:NCAIR mutase (PurE)-related protein
MTDKEAELAKQYPEASLLVAMAETAWAGSLKSVKIEFSLSDRLKTKLTELLGKEIHKIFITDSDARHIKKHHGQNENRRGQVDVIPADFAFIPVVLNEYDTAEQTGEDKIGNKKLMFTKKIEETFYLASIERGNNQIGVITLWKKKN